MSLAQALESAYLTEESIFKLPFKVVNSTLYDCNNRKIALCPIPSIALGIAKHFNKLMELPVVLKCPYVEFTE